ncbi:MAG TPA: hypothetical protein VKP67_16395 [Xanthobacteraceae bacterium]|nr:hypothetical protein [Xanthobacteraceae bacterium]
MTRAFRPYANHQAVTFVMHLHADIGGKIAENKRQAAKLAEEAAHIEAVIRMFDPAFDMKRIPPGAATRRTPWLKHGTLFRHAMDVLRTTTEPLTTRQIAEAIIAPAGSRTRPAGKSWTWRLGYRRR